jgi:hypothetical protein
MLRLGLTIGILAVSFATGALAAVPKPLPADLKRPFVGTSVPSAWIGLWRENEPLSRSVLDWHILPARSSECRSLTRGRVTCWTVGRPGTTTSSTQAYSGGSITISGGKVVIRMTWVPSKGSGLECFADDAYRYAYTAKRIRLLPDRARHCFRSLPKDPFTELVRLR